jgi:hypothetical protein
MVGGKLDATVKMTGDYPELTSTVITKPVDVTGAA